MTEDLKVAVRFKGNLRTMLEYYCEQVDMAPSAVIKALIADKLEKYIGSPLVSPQVYLEETKEKPQVSPQGDLPRTRRRLTKINKSSKEDLVEVDKRKFFKGFIHFIDFCEAPERVSRMIKDKWDDICESKLTAKELAESYNDYITDQKKNDLKHKHPEGWIAGHGWERKNNTEEKANEPDGNYDF